MVPYVMLGILQIGKREIALWNRQNPVAARLVGYPKSLLDK